MVVNMFHQSINSKASHPYEAFVFQNHNMAAHFHRNYEAVYVFEGSLEHNVDGRTTVLAAGDFALSLSNESHSHRTLGTSRCWFGIFSPDYVPEFHTAVKGKTTSDCRFRCDESLMPYLQDNLLFPGTPDTYRLIAGLNLLCGEFLRNITLVERSNPEYALMNDIVDYIAENYRNKLILKDVAAALGYDYYYFSKLFHQTFGQSFNEYLNTYRFNTALRSLRTTDKPISAIASESGFQSIRSFNDIFLKRTGSSPAQYRKQLNHKG